MIPEMPLSPVRPAERIHALDAIRGFALFGILVANWRGFAWPAELYPMPNAVLHTDGDLRAQFVVDLLFGNKFISMLSLLFGAGFAIQLDRSALRGASFPVFFSRRLAGLALIGAVHAFLIWWGDILLTYAVAGALLLLFRNASQRALLAWAGTLVLLPFWFSVWRIARFSPAAPAADLPVAKIVARAARAYLNGSWADRLRQSFHDWTVNNADGYFTVLVVLAWFLAGVYLWRSGFLQKLEEHKQLLKRVCLGGLVLGTAGLLLVLWVRRTWRPSPAHFPALLLAAVLVRVAAASAISFGYAAGIALFALSGRLAWLNQGLQAVGRTALSNYLLQSLAGTTLHSGYGFALYARVGALHAMLMSMAVFALQMPLSAWYLARWRTGPAEWLWRRITYGPETS